MNITRDTLDILFRRLQPEAILDTFRQTSDLLSRRDIPEISVRHVSKEVFQRYSYIGLEGFTPDEVENIYRYATQQMENKSGVSGKTEKSLFYLLTNYARSVLTEQGGEPLCKSGRLLDWRSISFRLGQDIFTTAYLALTDQKFGRKRTYFNWPAILHCDDPRFRALIGRGCVENHYHLNGSSRSQQISWINLMNHPENIGAYFHDKDIKARFQENLTPNLLLNAGEYQLEWPQRLRYACWLRVLLFRRIMVPESKKDFQTWVRNWRRPDLQSQELQKTVGNTRFEFGVQYPRSDGRSCCLDYAIIHNLDDPRGNSHNRILAGERALLYECFYRCFSREFSDFEQDLFYVYLLLKSNFRSELIQVNQRVGFRNFLRYQDRKSDFFANMFEYSAEAYRLSINAAMEDSHITSLEARIMPGKTDEETYRKILDIDREVLFAQDSNSFIRKDRAVEDASSDLSHFYVLHFAKKKLAEEEDILFTDLVMPRNSKTRSSARQAAIALATAFSTHNWVCARIRGIDACSVEVGCRPETFATEFRFLRGYIPPQKKHQPWETQAPIQPRLSASYHVGEDFLDLADGMRAIDEAMRFLNLRRGDRIGHALALGVEPKEYYSSKLNQIVLPKQDRLDDLVWLLYRSMELGVTMPTELRSRLTREANQLLNEIYGSYFQEKSWQFGLQDFYYSWCHRGDHPQLYRRPDGSEAEITPVKRMLRYRSPYGQYELFLRNDDGTPECTFIQKRLLHRYHYGKAERKIGAQIVQVVIWEQYAQFIRQMQEGLQSLMANRGVGIECNPSSNVLIGSLSRYEQHPIFRFNRHGLDGTSSENNLAVSVNTDDQGIFDTSLENEYALLANALARKRYADGKRMYSDDTIFHYLEHLRRLSKAQVFPSTK